MTKAEAFDKIAALPSGSTSFPREVQSLIAQVAATPPPVVKTYKRPKKEKFDFDPLPRGGAIDDDA